MEDENNQTAESGLAQHVQDQVMSEFRKQNYARDTAFLDQLRIEVMKAHAAFLGASRASMAPMHESSRSLAMSAAVATLVDLGGMLNKMEEKLGLEKMTFKMDSNSPAIPSFEGNYEQFRKWAENFWEQQDS